MKDEGYSCLHRWEVKVIPSVARNLGGCAAFGIAPALLPRPRHNDAFNLPFSLHLQPSSFLTTNRSASNTPHSSASSPPGCLRRISRAWRRPEREPASLRRPRRRRERPSHRFAPTAIDATHASPC